MGSPADLYGEMAAEGRRKRIHTQAREILAAIEDVLRMPTCEELVRVRRHLEDARAHAYMVRGQYTRT